MRIVGVTPEVVKTAEGHVIGVFLSAGDYEKVATMVEGKGFIPRPRRTFDRDGGGDRPPFRRSFSDGPREGGMGGDRGGDRPYFKKPYNKFADRDNRFGGGDRNDRFGGGDEGGFKKRRRFDDEGE